MTEEQKAKKREYDALYRKRHNSPEERERRRLLAKEYRMKRKELWKQNPELKKEYLKKDKIYKKKYNDKIKQKNQEHKKLFKKTTVPKTIKTTVPKVVPKTTTAKTVNISNGRGTKFCYNCAHYEYKVTDFVKFTVTSSCNLPPEQEISANLPPQREISAMSCCKCWQKGAK